jgi:hypothetical protein
VRAAKTIAVLLVATCASLLPTAAEAAPAPVPAWSIQAFPAPTHFKPGDASGADSYQMYFTDSGGAVTDHGGPNGEIELTVTLPVGVGVKTIELEPPRWGHLGFVGREKFAEEACAHAPVGGSEVVTCKISDSSLPGDEPAKVVPGGAIYLSVGVTVPSCPGSCMLVGGSIGVAGGGAAPVSLPLESLATEAEAEAGFDSFKAEVTGADGLPADRSATHPYQFTTSFALNTALAPLDAEFPIRPAEGDVKEIEVALPPGFAGNPTATPRCTQQQFNTVHSQLTGPNGEPSLSSTPVINACPDDSVVGTIAIQQLNGHGAGLGKIRPIYNLVPPEGMPAQLGFQILGLPIYINARLRSSEDYGVTTYLPSTAETEVISAARVMIWGNPADEGHDAMRGSCVDVGGLCPPVEALEPFLRLPSSCGSPQTFTMSFERWLHPGFIDETSTEPAPTGCDVPPFTPSIEARPTTDSADSPSGLHFDLHNPQPQDAEAPGEADLRDATVLLPEGLVVDPSSANGLEACSEAAVGYTGMSEGHPSFTAEPANCPDASKLGTVTIKTPLVDHPLPGAVYLARQGENPFNSLLAIYITVDDPVSGVVVKLAGHVEPDPGTGRLTTTVEENPQLPFEDFELDFFEGARAPLRTPPTCGTDTTNTTLVPWSAPEGPTAHPAGSFQISQSPGGCHGSAGELSVSPAGFEAGTEAPIAGTDSPIVIKLRREDASQEFGSVTLTPPPGLLASLAGIPYCPDSALAAAAAKSGRAEEASPSCPQASQVGTATIGAGAGPAPYYASGRAYLAGPYKGATLSLAVITPAVAGPFDLGTVVVRSALQVDPFTARITATTDPIPHILDGIPLDVRSIAIRLDHSGWGLNPTDCEPMSFDGNLQSVLGASASLHDRFQVGECGRLRFKPSLAISLKGQTTRAGHPAFEAVLTYPKTGAYANVAAAQVALPHSEFLDQGNLNKTCTRPVLLEGKCPATTVYGKAKAWTPLLDKPLEGPVYLVGGFGYELPALVAELNGQIRVLLVGKVDTTKQHGIRNTFEVVPDAPVSRFVLQMKGGKKYSLIENSENLCAKPQKVSARFTAQNGLVAQLHPTIKTGCKKERKRGHRHHRRGG